MTSQPPMDTDSETTLAQDSRGVDHAGSSMYGGRPTFALTRRDDADGVFLTLYELLPEEQATARNERLRRRNPNQGLVIRPFSEVFKNLDLPDADRWSWDGWTAVKVTGLSGSRLRSLFPLIKGTLSSAELDDSALTSADHANIFLPETVGIRLALGFLGIKPIQRVDRMRALCRGIARMSDEECYYWHAKCRSPSSPNGEKALRTMLTDHI